MSMTGAERFVEVAGARTRYFTTGAGEPILLLHGGSLGSSIEALSADDWDPVFGLLATSTQVTAIDRLGHGYTDNPQADAGYTLSASVAHAVAFLRARGGPPTHVVGHGLGGFVACRLALEHPDLVRSCVIVDATPLSPGIGRNHIVHAQPPEPRLTRGSIRWVLERYCFDRQSVTDAWADAAASIAETDRNRAAVRKMNEGGLERSLYLPELAKQAAQTQRAIVQQGMPCPTLVVAGMQDPTADVDNCRLFIEMAQHRQAKTEARYVNHAGHFVFREQPQAFALLLLRFVAAYGGGHA